MKVIGTFRRDPQGEFLPESADAQNYEGQLSRALKIGRLLQDGLPCRHARVVDHCAGDHQRRKRHNRKQDGDAAIPIPDKSPREFA